MIAGGRGDGKVSKIDERDEREGSRHSAGERKQTRESNAGRRIDAVDGRGHDAE